MFQYVQVAVLRFQIRYVIVAVQNSAVSYWPKMSQYVLVADPNLAISYWPKMSQYAGIDSGSNLVVSYWPKMSPEYVLIQIRSLVTGLKCCSM